jgi:hypothetical protein
MALDINREVAAVRPQTVTEQRARHQELFGEPSRSVHKQHLVRRITWRLQALAEGDLTERARRRAAELARDADLRIRAPREEVQSDQTASPEDSPPPRDGRLPAPGTLLVRSYQGRTLQVKVLEQGFEYDGQISSSLTAVARQITGQHWNGYHFFGLTEAPP